MINFSPNSNVYRTLNTSISTDTLKLTSGNRIFRASEDAAGLAISERLASNINSDNVAIRNVLDGKSALQVSDMGLSSVSNILTRMKELATSASNGTLSPQDRSNLQKEFSELREEVKHISGNTNFNTKQLLDNNNAIALQVSKEAGGQFNLNNHNVSIPSLGLDGIDLTQNPAVAIKQIDDAFNIVSEMRADIGAQSNRLDVKVTNLQQANINAESSRSRIADAHLAKVISNKIKHDAMLRAEFIMQAHKNQSKESIYKFIV